MTAAQACGPGRACSAIEAEDLSVWYGDACAVRDVNVKIAPCAITALIGPSGCGKSTFLASINRMTELYEGCRSAGVMRVDGEDVRGLDPIVLRRRVGMIFQRPNPFPLSIRANIAFPLREHGMRERDAREAAVEQALCDAGLWEEVKDRLDESALALSGGQKQRLCIARAIALKPDVLLLDEPCSALDPISSGVVEDLVLGLRGRYTVVIVTHNLAQARRVADDVGVFWVQEDAGRLIEFGPRDTVFEAPAHPLTAAYISGARG